MAKDSFILYLDQLEIFEMLTDEQAGQLIKNIFQYESTGQMPKMDKMLNLAFVPIMKALDRNRDKYEKIVERNKANIKKRWNKNDTKNTNGKNGIQKNTKNTDNDNVRVNDNVRDNATTTVVNNASDSCVDGLQNAIDFYNANIGLITPYGLEVLEDYSKEIPVDVIVYAMQIAVEANKKTIQYIKAILNNWQKAGIKTLTEAKKESQKGKSHKRNEKKQISKASYEQRDYNDFDFTQLYANK